MNSWRCDRCGRVFTGMRIKYNCFPLKRFCYDCYSDMEEKKKQEKEQETEEKKQGKKERLLTKNIRESYRSGYTPTEIGKLYGISTEEVYRRLNR